MDDRVICSAKRYAKEHGSSISEMVGAYLSAVSAAASLPDRDAPVLRSVRGAMKKGGLKEYRKHLAVKYR